MAALYAETMVGFVNWHRALREGWAVDEVVCDSREQVARLHTLWYRNAAGEERRWSDPDAGFATVGSLSRNLHRMTRDDHERVFRFVLGVEESQRDLILTLPAVQVNGATLLLDGIHRCVGLGFLNVRFRVLLHRLCCPDGATSWVEELIGRGGYVRGEGDE